MGSQKTSTTPKVCEQPLQLIAFSLTMEFEEKSLLVSSPHSLHFEFGLFRICLKALFFQWLFIWPLAQFLWNGLFHCICLHWNSVYWNCGDLWPHSFWNWAVPTLSLSYQELPLQAVLIFSLISFGTGLFLGIVWVRNFSCCFKRKKSQRNGIPVIRMLWCPP